MKTFALIGLLGILTACGHTPTNKAPLTTLTSDGVVPGAIIVDMKDNVSSRDIADLSSIAGTELTANNPTAQKYKFEEGIVDPAHEDEILAKLRADSRVEHAEPIVEYKALYTPNDPKYGEQWGLTRVGAQSAWNTTCGEGAIVAVLDTGVAAYDTQKFHRLSDFANTKFVDGYNFVDDNDVAYDVQSHGSHVSGTIAESTNNGIEGAGLAHCASIMPVKVLSDQGSGTNEAIAEGIRWAVDHGAQVINMSLGGPYPSDVLEDAVNYAHAHGTLVVCAAGNSGGRVGYPAAFTNSLAVSAIDNTDNIAKFSSRGPQVAIAAPGVNICQQTVSDNGKGETWACYNGTSMATPHVAAAAALLYSQGITNPDAVKARLQSSADPKDNPNLYGAGILRADNAVRSVIFSHFLYRLLALFALMFLLRKYVKWDQLKNGYAIGGITLGGFGLMPLLFTGLLPRMGAFRIVGEVLARPLGEWDILAGLSHNYLLFANFIPAALATVLLLSHKSWRLFAGGLALGSAALCTQLAVTNEVHFFLGGLVMKIWMLVCVIICGYFAKATFSKSA